MGLISNKRQTLEQVFEMFCVNREVRRIDSLNLIAVIMMAAKGKFE